MAQKNTTTVLSATAKAIVDAYINQNVFESHRANTLVIELYSRREGADKNLINLSRKGLLPCALTLTEEDYAVLDAEYNEVVKYCHSFIVGLEKAQNDAGSIHFPSELLELCSKLIESTRDETIFLPYAGYCDMAFALESKSVLGFDFNMSTVAFNNILFDAYGISGKIFTGDSLSPKLESKEQYDHVISIPPQLSSKKDREIAQYMLDLLQGDLADGGDMCLVLPVGHLSSLQWISFRRYLMEHKAQFNVLTISLPAVFMPVTSVKYSIMFIQKRENPLGTFFFMDADRKEFYTVSQENQRKPHLKVDSILESIRVMDEGYFREVDVENDVLFGKHTLCSFAPSRYFVYDNLPKLKTGYKYYELKQLVGSLYSDVDTRDLYDEIEYVGPKPSKCIRFNSLSDNYITSVIDLKNLTPTLLPNDVYRAYATGGYVSFLNEQIKVGQVLDDNSFVTIDSKVAHFALKPDEKARLDYLLRELTSDYVLEQAQHLSFGITTQEMRSSDFYKLKIAVPSLEIQDEILKQDRIDAVEKAGVKVDALNEKFRKDIHMMKHALGQTVFNLSNWMQALNQARKQGNGILDENAQLGGLVKVSTGEVFDNIEKAIKVLSRQVSSFDVGYGMKVSQFSLADFIDKYIETHPRPNVKYDFSSAHYRTDIFLNEYADGTDIIEIPGNPVMIEGVAMDYVVFPEEALEIIVDNIVSNAVSHGFKEPEKEYTIHFEFKPEGTSYILSISNNGEPLPADQNPEDVFVLGNTSGGGDHAGIGGYQVRSLMEDFAGKAEILSTPQEAFKVTYKLTFTKTNLI